MHAAKGWGALLTVVSVGETLRNEIGSSAIPGPPANWTARRRTLAAELALRELRPVHTLLRFEDVLGANC